MYKNNLIIFSILLLVGVVTQWYFPSEIAKYETQYIEQKKLSLKYFDLKEKYSKKSIKKEKRRIIEFLDAFGIKYTTKPTKRTKKTNLTMILKKTNANKIVSYVLNSKLIFEAITIQKIDDYTLSFSVKY